MKFGKKDKDKKPKPEDVKWKPIKEKPSMWCRKHGCTKVACGCN